MPSRRTALAAVIAAVLVSPTVLAGYDHAAGFGLLKAQAPLGARRDVPVQSVDRAAYFKEKKSL